MRYLYQETSEEETKEISNALVSDSLLQEQYNELIATTELLDFAQLQPASSSIQNILSYSRSLRE
jgi:hypothetical protein